MSAKIGLKYIGPKKIFPTAIEIENAIEKKLTLTAADAQIDFIKLVSNWKDKVVFTIKTLPMERQVGTSNRIFKFVSQGTPVRYAYMSTDFMAKTKPGSLTSGSGAGRKWGVNVNNPRPGIKARDFDKQIAEKYQKKFGPAIQKELSRLFK
ncbi:MAG: hypothetical protein J0I20_34060 [Chloroflexi bacterium]|nr:hypothetical protein [Chloroflexota bacterium]OJW05581.1 MAG: hypothetical protein BGO39_02900 [Chloroflexi bacterium 54-19]